MSICRVGFVDRIARINDKSNKVEYEPDTNSYSERRVPRTVDGGNDVIIRRWYPVSLLTVLNLPRNRRLAANLPPAVQRMESPIRPTITDQLQV